MHSNSRLVRSSQQLPHPRPAEALAARHRGASFRKPPAPYSLAAFARLLAAWDGEAPLVLDAGCGTGASTLALARQFPRSFVVGVDQSAARLAQSARQAAPANALLLRADLVDIWLLMAGRRMRLAGHYLLYPNPWPKPAQVMRRWPAHPVFPTLLGAGRNPRVPVQLAGSAICRRIRRWPCNWRAGAYTRIAAQFPPG